MLWIRSSSSRRRGVTLEPVIQESSATSYSTNCSIFDNYSVIDAYSLDTHSVVRNNELEKKDMSGKITFVNKDLTAQKKLIPNPDTNWHHAPRLLCIDFETK
jgi:hypothetical protein